LKKVFALLLILTFANLNQVLALLVGPQGVPGAAGVAGRDGFVGMNGQDGRDGIDGAPGAIGPQGVAGVTGVAGPAGAPGPEGPRGPAGINGTTGSTVLAVVVAVGSAECSGNGGTKFVTAGVTTYACNGIAGSGSGGSGGTTFTFGQGTVQIGTCDGDATVGFTFPTTWSGTDFFLGEVRVTGVDGDCIDANLKLYFKIKSTGQIFVPSSNYALGDNLICTHPLTTTEPGLGANPRTLVDNTLSVGASTSCVRTSSAGEARSNLLLGNIGTRDLSDWVGFEIL
jgi:hypothetical protein